MAKHESNQPTWVEMPKPQFDKAVEAIKADHAALLSKIEALLPGCVSLTEEQRAILPRLRDGEHAALLAVLEAVEVKPALYDDLADEDEGHDSGRFEVGLLRERISKHRALVELAGSLARTSRVIDDAPLYLAGQFRDAVLAAYRIAKTHAKNNVAINTKLAPAIDFYAKPAQRAADTRAKKGKTAE